MNDHDDANRRFYEDIERKCRGFYLAARDRAEAAKAEREAHPEAVGVIEEAGVVARGLGDDIMREIIEPITLPVLRWLARILYGKKEGGDGL